MPEDDGFAAYVLHRYAYQETSLVVELLTAEHGRVGVIARGARRPRSALANLQPWQEYLVAWRGKGDLVTLVQAEEHGPLLRPDPLATLCGFYLNELLLRLLTRWDPHPALFETYRATLLALARGEAPDWILRRFEYVLLRETGFGPDLERCRDCGELLKDTGETWYYLPQKGIFCPVHGGGDEAVSLSGRAFRQLTGQQGMPGGDERRALRHWLGRELAALLNHKPLRSQDLLRAYWHQRRAMGEDEGRTSTEDTQ